MPSKSFLRLAIGRCVPPSRPGAACLGLPDAPPSRPGAACVGLRGVAVPLLFAAFGAALLPGAMPGSALAQERPGGWTPPPLPELREAFPELRAELEARIVDHRGVVGLALLDPASGEGISIRGEEPFPSASVIKIPILYEVMLRVEAGDLAMDRTVVMQEEDRVGGSGVLRHLTAPFPLPVRDAAFLMTAHSDNVATNLLLAEVGAREVTERMAAFGLPGTRVFRPVFGSAQESFDPDGAGRWGLGVTTPLETARLLAWIHREEAVSAEASREMLGMLRAQTHRVGIPRGLPAGTRVAHKTGSINAARHDCGIVSGPTRDYVLCILTRENEDTTWGWDNEAEILQGDLSRLVFEALSAG